MSTTAVPLDPAALAPQAEPAGAIPTNQPPAAPQAPEPVEWFNDPNLFADPVAQPQAAPQPQEFVIQAPTGTVYKAADWNSLQQAVSQGVAEKDRVIAEQKAQLARAQQLLAATGVQMQSGGQPAASVSPQQARMLYALRDALDKGDGTFDQALVDKVEQTADRRFQERFGAFVEPLLPMIEHANETWGVQEAGSKYDPNIPAFVKSPAFGKVLKDYPHLGNAFQFAKRDPQGRAMLPELYSLAFNTAKAMVRAPAPQPAPQRLAPASTVPPQTLLPMQAPVPQAPAQPSIYQQMGVPQDPFDAAFNAVPHDIVEQMMQLGNR